jgi:signal transduction histidine kinase
MKRLIPDTIAVRTLLVMILGLGFSHAASVALYTTDRTSILRFSSGEHVGERIATIDRLIRNSFGAERQRLIQLTDGSRFQVALTQESYVTDPVSYEQNPDEFREALLVHLNPAGERMVRVQFLKGSEPESITRAAAWPARNNDEEIVIVSLALPDGGWLNFAVPIETPESSWSFRFGLSMAIMLAAVAVFSILLVQHISRPLATFARAAQRLGVDVDAPSIPETGPAEVRKVTQAFNEMQNRIKRFVEDRTQMIAAISHDLGTPITRMRLRAEFVEDDEQRLKMLADLDDMEKMTLSALSFVRDEADHEPQAMVDLRTVLQRICDDAKDVGHQVTLQIGDEPVPYGCRPVAMRRAISNLVENAIRYGAKAHLTLQETSDSVFVNIEDRGPGIPEDRLDDVFKPFHRLDESRNRETGGTGLGLTVARTIVRAHGGDIVLRNRDKGGLRVSVTLPR